MEHFVKIMLLIVIVHLTLIETAIDRVWHHLRHDGEYKIPQTTIIMLWVYAAAIVIFVVQSCLS